MNIILSPIIALALTGAFTQARPLGTAFTYQGRLDHGGQPANGTYDFAFTLRDAGPDPLAGPVTNAAVAVSNGLFTTTVDFGGGLFTGDARWLQLAVRTNGPGQFTTLSPPQELTPAPCALYAPSAGWAAAATTASAVAAGAVGASALATNCIGSAHLQTGSVGSEQLAAGSVGTTALARNAVTADNLARQLSVTARLVVTNPIPGTGGGLGCSIASGGRSAGLPFEPYPSSVGAVCFDLNADGSWGMILTNPYPANADRFGHAVWNAGEEVIVGAPGDNAGAGAVRIYNVGAQEWLEHFLNPTANPVGDEFGHCLLAMAGLAVGAPLDSDNPQALSHAGAVHVFPYNGGTQRTVLSPQPATNANFGYALAGLWAGPQPVWAVGEPSLDHSSRPGAVHFFQGDDWTWLCTVTNAVAQSGDQFGHAVAAFGNDMFIVGAPRGGEQEHGKVCIFRADATHILSVDSDNPEVAGFGKAITAIGTDYFAVGAPDALGANGISEVGCVYIYRADGTCVAWLQNPSWGRWDVGDEHFGHALACSGGELWVGAPGANDGDGVIHDYSLLEWLPGVAVGNVLDASITSSKLAAGAALANLIQGDGPGSGLDADLLDGQHAAAFAPATHDHDPQYVNEGQPNSVAADMIADGAITDSHINPAAAISDAKLTTITSPGKVADSALSSNVSLLGQSIESSEILDGTIVAADIAANTSWSAGGNAGTTSGLHFLGTTDDQALELKINNTRALRLEPNATSPNLIGGHPANSVAAGVYGATIGGGGWGVIPNRIEASMATISGGSRNTIETNAWLGVIGGGQWNTIHAEADNTTIGGGTGNTIQTNADSATIAGGSSNTIETNAFCSTVGGGSMNIIRPSATLATIPGGGMNEVAGAYGLAAGCRAKANHQGSFVWGDSTEADIASTNANSITFRASGGYRLFSNSGSTVGTSLAAGGNSWSAISDRNLKENLKPVDPAAVLERVSRLPISEWNLISQPPTIRHIGPMAQDFSAAFQVGEDNRHITTTDADGVALAAIQGLNQKLEEALKRTEAENAALKKRLERLEQLLAVRHGGAP